MSMRLGSKQGMHMQVPGALQNDPAAVEGLGAPGGVLNICMHPLHRGPHGIRVRQRVRLQQDFLLDEYTYHNMMALSCFPPRKPQTQAARSSSCLRMTHARRRWCVHNSSYRSLLLGRGGLGGRPKRRCCQVQVLSRHLVLDSAKIALGGRVFQDFAPCAAIWCPTRNA